MPGYWLEDRNGEKFRLNSLLKYVFANSDGNYFYALAHGPNGQGWLRKDWVIITYNLDEVLDSRDEVEEGPDVGLEGAGHVMATTYWTRSIATLEQLLPYLPIPTAFIPPRH